jgi:hypothetical protein
MLTAVITWPSFTYIMFFSLLFDLIYDAPESSLMDSIANPKVKTMEGDRVRAHFLDCSTSGVEGRVGIMGWD